MSRISNSLSGLRFGVRLLLSLKCQLPPPQLSLFRFHPSTSTLHQYSTLHLCTTSTSPSPSPSNLHLQLRHWLVSTLPTTYLLLSPAHTMPSFDQSFSSEPVLVLPPQVSISNVSSADRVQGLDPVQMERSKTIPHLDAMHAVLPKHPLTLSPAFLRYGPTTILQHPLLQQHLPVPNPLSLANSSSSYSRLRRWSQTLKR